MSPKLCAQGKQITACVNLTLSGCKDGEGRERERDLRRAKKVVRRSRMFGYLNWKAISQRKQNALEAHALLLWSVCRSFRLLLLDLISAPPPIRIMIHSESDLFWSRKSALSSFKSFWKYGQHDDRSERHWRIQQKRHLCKLINSWIQSIDWFGKEQADLPDSKANWSDRLRFRIADYNQNRLSFWLSGLFRSLCSSWRVRH